MERAYHARMPPALDAWSLLRRIAFRFGLSAALLMTVPFPLRLIPGTGAIAAAFGLASIALRGFGYYSMTRDRAAT
jgi:hypothetical protein